MDDATTAVNTRSKLPRDADDGLFSGASGIAIAQVELGWGFELS